MAEIKVGQVWKNKISGEHIIIIEIVKGLPLITWLVQEKIKKHIVIPPDNNIITTEKITNVMKLENTILKQYQLTKLKYINRNELE